MRKTVTLSILAVILLITLVAMAADPEPPARRGGRGPQFEETETMDKDPLGQNKAEQKILDILADIKENQSKGMMQAPIEDARLLRILTESIGAKNVVEIGTSNGYSGIWFCLALKKTGGHLTTHEIDEDRAAMARKNFKRAGVDKMVTLVFGDAHENVKKLEKPIDLLFLDADKSGYIDYLEKLLPLVKPGGLICAHNTTNAGRDMQPYLDAITSNPDLDTLFLHQTGRGISVSLKKR
jgi:predicted O-methyltransferase YrrM